MCRYNFCWVHLLKFHLSAFLSRLLFSPACMKTSITCNCLWGGRAPYVVYSYNFSLINLSITTSLNYIVCWNQSTNSYIKCLSFLQGFDLPSDLLHCRGPVISVDRKGTFVLSYKHDVMCCWFAAVPPQPVNRFQIYNFACAQFDSFLSLFFETDEARQCDSRRTLFASVNLKCVV